MRNYPPLQFGFLKLLKAFRREAVNLSESLAFLFRGCPVGSPCKKMGFLGSWYHLQLWIQINDLGRIYPLHSIATDRHINKYMMPKLSHTSIQRVRTSEEVLGLIWIMNTVTIIGFKFKNPANLGLYFVSFRPEVNSLSTRREYKQVNITTSFHFLLHGACSLSLSSSPNPGSRHCRRVFPTYIHYLN